MNEQSYSYLFGPVPSRRLGRSLGVDLTPFKTCSFDCIFCQLGRTTHKTAERREYVPVNDIIAELDSWLKNGGGAITTITELTERTMQMIIAVASGKGGTGKTTFAVNLAYALAKREQTVPTPVRKQVRLLDCDVEEPDSHLFLRPEFTEETAVTVPRPLWDRTECSGCGACAAACHYNALALVKGQLLIFDELCHACGACAYVCPRGALSERQAVIGKVQQTCEQTTLFFAQGLLNIGESMAPDVVKAVKERIVSAAVNIIDAAPGTACQVVEAISGADAALLVTEPTPFGLHDLKLAVRLTLKLGIPTGIIINRSDGRDSAIVEYAEKFGLSIAGRIPFKRTYAEAYSRGEILAAEFPELSTDLLRIYDHLATALPPQPATEVFASVAAEPAVLAHGTSENYREIAVISGKGGTGKTTVLASLAQLAANQVLADNDVDAANLHLLLAPSIREKHNFVGGRKARVDGQKCIGCGECATICHFHAIEFDLAADKAAGSSYQIKTLACQGCGLCQRICPVGAITMQENITGQWFVSGTDYGPMVHASLGIGEENSGRLVTQVRSRAAALAQELKQELILADGPPGTGCPVIASISGADLVVIVTEPTVAGAHDLERVLKLAAHFCVPAVVVINKADLNLELVRRIEELAAVNQARVIGRIPFDHVVNDALQAGKTVVEYGESCAAKAIRAIWKSLHAHGMVQ